VCEFLLEPVDGDHLAAKLASRLLARDARAGPAVDPATGLYDVQGLARCARDLTRRAFNHRAPLACVVLAPEVAAADPGYFRTEQSRDLLYRALTSAAHIDAVYVSFEDGYHRVVTRIDEDRRRADPRIPATANWHSSYIDAIK